MPTVTLLFSLPEEETECRQAMDASRYASLLEGIREHIRSRLKYHELGSGTEELEWLRDFINGDEVWG